MKRLILLFIFCLIATSWAAAQETNADSIAYQSQRKKINSMLADRKLKFGQYDQSLSEHTGFFGMQTKNDIRKSNDILMDIVKTDDSIFKELKILLEYRAFQQRQVESRSKETEAYTLSFMNTINKLRQQNALLKSQAEDTTRQQNRSKLIYIAIIAALIALYIISRRRKIS